jgi:hypothetical protein
MMEALSVTNLVVPIASALVALRLAFKRNACGRVCTGRYGVDQSDAGSRANLCGRCRGLSCEPLLELFAGFSRLAGTATLQIGAHLPRHLRLQRRYESTD